MNYFENPVDAGDGRCSDDACPCPEVHIPRGQGYLYIAPDIVAFRRRFPQNPAATAEIMRRINDLRRTNDLYRNASIRYRIDAVLICEQGATLRNLDLKIAAADARHWWKTGQVPLRPTPLANGTVPPVVETELTGIVSAVFTQQKKKWWQRGK